jgi:hypothetical protein
MNQPKLKAIVFFLGTLGVGFAIGVLLLPTLRIPYTVYNFINVTAFAFLFAVVLTVWPGRSYRHSKPTGGRRAGPSQC